MPCFSIVAMFALMDVLAGAKNLVLSDDRVNGNPVSRQPSIEFLRPRSQSLASISLDRCRTVGIQLGYVRITTAEKSLASRHSSILA